MPAVSRCRLLTIILFRFIVKQTLHTVEHLRYKSQINDTKSIKVYNMDLGQGIRVMLAKRQISQTKLAREVGVTRTYMSSLCNNDRVASLGLLERMASALNCGVWEILKEAENG